jgi:hypothetical protein
VWAGANPSDPVGASGYFGNNPVSKIFGGQVFGVQDTGFASWVTLAAHSEYFNPGGSSLNNIGHIATGEYGSVTHASHVLTRPDVSAGGH